MQFKFLYLDWEGVATNLKLVISKKVRLRNLFKKVVVFLFEVKDTSTPLYYAQYDSNFLIPL